MSTKLLIATVIGVLIGYAAGLLPTPSILLPATSTYRCQFERIPNSFIATAQEMNSQRSLIIVSNGDRTYAFSRDQIKMCQVSENK